MKTLLEIQPVYHGSELGVRGHVHTCVLALLLARSIEDRLVAAGMAQYARTALDQLATIQEVEVEVGCRRLRRLTRLSEEQRALLQALRVPLPEELSVA